jgi:hypothetical protein
MNTSIKISLLNLEIP